MLKKMSIGLLVALLAVGSVVSYADNEVKTEEGSNVTMSALMEKYGITPGEEGYGRGWMRDEEHHEAMEKIMEEFGFEFGEEGFEPGWMMDEDNYEKMKEFMEENDIEFTDESFGHGWMMDDENFERGSGRRWMQDGEELPDDFVPGQGRRGGGRGGCHRFY